MPNKTQDLGNVQLALQIVCSYSGLPLSKEGVPGLKIETRHRPTYGKFWLKIVDERATLENKLPQYPFGLTYRTTDGMIQFLTGVGRGCELILALKKSKKKGRA